ncbi:YetF domain-containing protein [Paenibacillus sp. UNC499MF]|uniref:YetF domain-containing protein n=1 Tax=Paenibacillus sp. UNC499MF TaxID=1502751 RepID=UPI00089FF79C|nr:YetF domain-containing protein [Paenibacillus sp. UNC499MF]SEG13927.1 hypothetical protein SAMN02799616_02002 [Paenibacillus sp. UNC499MF]
MNRNTDFSYTELKAAEKTGEVPSSPSRCDDSAIPVIVRGHVLPEGLKACGWDKARLWHELDQAGMDSLLDVAYAEIRRDALIIKSP